MDDEALAVDDGAARRDALDPGRSFIVQAPAGSGKTELLIQRYLTLLATVDHPEEIYAITFTVKAAREMQLRVTAALLQARDGDEPAEAHARITFDAARKVLERDRLLNWKLIDSPRRMRIQTLDALNSHIARSLPFSSGLGGAVNVLADEEIQAFYRNAAAATLDWLLSDDDANHAIERVLVHLDNNVAVYMDHIAGMLATRDQWLPVIGAGPDAAHSDDVRALLERNIAARISAHLQTVRSLFPPECVAPLVRLGRYAAHNVLHAGQSGAPPAALGDCAELPPAAADRLDDWRAFAELLLTQSGSLRKTVNRNNGFPTSDPGAKTEMIECLQALGRQRELCAALHEIRQLPNPRYTDEQWSVLLALFRVLPLAVVELRRLFSERGMTDYTEVAIAADEALGSVDDPGDVALLLDYRVSHLLIDEMQDTSTAQYRLLEKLVAGWQPGDGRTLFCVGDPMQSIYRFRNAEVGQFLLARRSGVGGVRLEPLLLRHNFRSGERLVQWFNTVFEQAFPRRDDIAAGAIAYAVSVPVEAHRAAGAYTIHPLFGITAEDEAGYGVEIIRECLDSRADETTAVLVRSRTHLPRLLQKLREAGIDYQAIEIDRLTDLPEIADMLALTRSLCHRGDRIAWLGLLRAPWVGLTWSDLHVLVRNDRRNTVWELLHDGRRLAALPPEAAARVRSFARQLAPFVAGHGTASLRETVERAWYALRGPLVPESAEAVENIYRFLDVLGRLDTAGTLPDVAELEATLDHERVSSRGGHDARLQIMTMHKAKGLQFDHVVLFGLGHRPRAGTKNVLGWLNLPGSDGRKDMLISPIGPRTEIENDPLHQYIESIGRRKERFEQDRLLYVACTRARRSLHLLGNVALQRDGGGFRGPPAGSLLHGIWPAVQAGYAKAFEAGTKVAATPRSRGRAVFRTPELYRLGDEALPPLPPLPSSDAVPDAVETSDGRPVEYYWVGSVARHAGTIVHRWLKGLAEGAPPIDAATPANVRAASRRWARELGVPAADIDAICDRVGMAVAGMLDDARGRWLLTGEGHAELALTGLRNDRLESIVIDRIRVDDDGVHWIVDYKTSTHEGGDLAGFLQQEISRYRPQLEKYAELYRELVTAPVRTALYFPLLKEFREIDSGP